MKTKTLLITVFILFNYFSTLLGQSVNCSDFSVIGVNPDTLNPNGYIVTIQFNATSNIFVNYPHVSAVLDCNGDTVATGGLSFFGQFGQTTNDYPVTVSGSLACEPLKAVFVYSEDNFNNDTCLLTFGATSGISNASQIVGKFSIFPNPSINQVNIQTNLSQIGTSYLVYDHTGKLILTGKLVSESTTVDMSDFSNGMYFFKIGDNLGEIFKVVKE
jgi:hypothetical protein